MGPPNRVGTRRPTDGTAPISAQSSRIGRITAAAGLPFDKRIYPAQHVTTRRPDTVHAEEGSRIHNVYQLPSTQPDHHQVALPDPASRRTSRPTSWHQVFSRKSTCDEVTIRLASLLKIVTRRHSEPATAAMNTCAKFLNRKNQDHTGMEAAQQHQGTAKFFWIRQLRPPVYPQYGGLFAPLTDRLKDYDCFWRGETQEAAFDQLKIALTSLPVLRISDPDRPYKVITDASNITIGAVLLQDFGDGLQPVAYESRKLQGAGKNYTVHDKEMLAIVHAFKTWRCYLTGADVTVRTHHKSLKYLRANQTSTRDRSDGSISSRITHNPTSGHFGVDKTTKTLQRNYYWPNMADDVRKYVSSCTACQIMKSSHQRAVRLLQPLDPPERPWQHVTMDYMTGLPAGPYGNDAILVVVD
ncbi:hypothetical protein CLOP_g9149 [Closterium sp. NIES-67]|nr:hypothetical protein CLOP_g4232 [Closterium sp. NIES-67]GJP78884.1 hypothetical protein CLOP_g9149 [Closterium sp. NIES-67]